MKAEIWVNVKDIVHGVLQRVVGRVGRQVGVGLQVVGVGGQHGGHAQSIQEGGVVRVSWTHENGEQKNVNRKKTKH